tara:strand:- start:1199 stop:1408 length:210 start_codon:yes stop_codon:yes gene_type:complete
MSVLAVLKAVFTGLAELFGFLKDRRLMNAGKAEQQRNDLLEHQERVDRANDARADPARLERLRERRFRD